MSVKRSIALMALLLFALAFPFPALSQEVDADVVLSEVEEQLDHLREWVNDRLADHESGEEESRPLDKTVSITITLGGTDRSVTIVTAMSRYAIATEFSISEGQAEERHENSEMVFQCSGEVSMDATGDFALVTCTGSVRTVTFEMSEGAEEASETAIEFDASARFSSGKSHLIASQDNLKLTMAVAILSED